jgi:hypothetical protein
MTTRLNAAVLAAIAVAASLSLFSIAPVFASDGVIAITQAKALAGNVSPGDTPGFPVRLAKSGSYRFDTDLHPPSGTTGIVIAADNVTIDLNGFQLAGGTLAAIGVQGTNRTGISIRNGTISGFKSDGIRGTGVLWTVDKMRIEFNGGNGISAGHLLRLRDSALYRNGLKGVVSINHATILDSTIVGSGGDGVICENHCLIANNLISQNGLSGLGVGISASSATILGNTITANRGFGIDGSFSGYGNNALLGNNNSGSGPQISSGLFPLHPNACSPAC